MSRVLRSWLFGALAVSVIGSAQARDLRVADNTASDYPTVEALKHMGTLLSERTKGRLGLKVFANAALGGDRDTLEQVKLGGLEMLRISAAPLNTFTPETTAISLPYVFLSENPIMPSRVPPRFGKIVSQIMFVN
jgi:TRAP-type C4-dicarboxylate transport system substrate-binding protein